ncbi:MAG TPA: cytochrome P450 [Acidimicrobiales bacterium]|nr:cytochrome P450 [Acidimicrobiales bacterium]
MTGPAAGRFRRREATPRHRREAAMTSTAVRPPLAYSPYDYAIHEDPYPTYARLRAEAPVYRNDALDFWALSRHRDVLAAFRDVDHFSNAYGVSLDPAAFGPDAHRAMSFLAMDPPAHTRLRSLVGKSFTPRRVAELEPRIRELTVEHLEPALEQGSFDFVADFAGKLPMDVISELVGVPKADRAELRRLADLVVHREEGVTDVPPEGAEAAMVLAAYYADMVADRRRRPADDLTSALLAADLDGDRITDEEAIGILFLMVVAGNETTTKLLANAWYWAWRFPDQRAKPFADPARVPDWVEETLRYDNSTQMLVRVTRQDVAIPDGIVDDGAGPGRVATIPEGDKVLLLVGSANRDEAVFAHPDRYDLDRAGPDGDGKALVSFGGGRHFCMGAPLARLEARVALGELVARTATYDVDPDGIRRVHSINVRGFAALPTTVVVR